jgi:hypothetical protein
VKIVTKKRAAAAAAALLLAGGGMAAWAYWTGGGSGSGGASATTPVNLVVNQTNATISNLFPGGPAQALSGNFDNSNSGPITLSSLTASVHSFSSSLVDASKPACTQADFAITGTATIGGSGVVPAGTGVGSWSGLNVSLTNAGTNQNNCKGVSITIDYTAS